MLSLLSLSLSALPSQHRDPQEGGRTERDAHQVSEGKGHACCAIESLQIHPAGEASCHTINKHTHTLTRTSHSQSKAKDVFGLSKSCLSGLPMQLVSAFNISALNRMRKLTFLSAIKRAYHLLNCMHLADMHAPVNALCSVRRTQEQGGGFGFSHTYALKDIKRKCIQM